MGRIVTSDPRPISRLYYTFLEFLELDVDLVNLETKVDLEVCQPLHVALQRTNPTLELISEIVCYLPHVTVQLKLA